MTVDIERMITAKEAARMRNLYTTLEGNVVCAMTDKYPSEFESDEDKAYWLEKARQAIEAVKDHVITLLASS